MAETVVFLHSTISPNTTKRVADEAAKKGIKVLDAPVTSVPRQVREGKFVFLVGGADKEVAEHRPHLESLGATVIHFGPLAALDVASYTWTNRSSKERTHAGKGSGSE